MSVAHTSHIRIEKHQGPHRTAHVEGFSDAIDFGIHGGIKHFYRFKIPPGTREKAERALDVFSEGCPAYQSVKGCIDCSWTAEIDESES